VQSETDFEFEQHRVKRFIVDPAKGCIANIRNMKKELDMDYLSLTFRFALGPDHERHLECIRRFAAEVIPAPSSTKPPRVPVNRG